MRNKDAVEMMERCHQRLEEEAERLRRASASGDLGQCAECLEFFARTTRRHYADEEQSVFPRLDGDRAALVAVLTAEHRDHEALLHEMRTALSQGKPLAELSERWAGLLGAHAAREDDEILPWLRALDDETRATMATEMQARRGRGGGDGGGGGRRAGGGGGS